MYTNKNTTARKTTEQSRFLHKKNQNYPYQYVFNPLRSEKNMEKNNHKRKEVSQV